MNSSSSASKTYDIHFLLNDKRFFWKNPNRGVTITDAGRDSCLSWEADSGHGATQGPIQGRRLWTDIIAVALSSTTDGRNEVNRCRIAFRGGGSLTLTDTGANGQLDESRTPIYRDFVRALHLRLAQAPPGTIRFSAGMSDRRYLGMKIVLAIAGLLFVATPVVLLFLVQDWRVFGILFAGLAFTWAPWKIVLNNRPRSYDPKHPPGELMG
jgi:hypothetical protein